MPKIDAHVHVFTKVSPEFPREVSDVLPADREEPVEKLMDEMAAHGIDRAVLVQIGGVQYAHHAYLLHCLKTYPGKFLGIGLIPPDGPPEDQMDRLADGTGVIGFRLHSLGGPRDPSAPVDVRTFDAYPVWKHAAERDYVLWLYLQARDAHRVAHLVEEFPQVRIVMNHLGVCPDEGKFRWDEKGRPRIETPAYDPAFHATHRLARYENVMIHLSGQYAFSKESYPYRDLTEWHHGLFKDFGPKRLMWATDFPWIQEAPGYGPLTSIIRALLPDIAERAYDEIMGDTAKRFLRFPDSL